MCSSFLMYCIFTHHELFPVYSTLHTQSLLHIVWLSIDRWSVCVMVPQPTEYSLNTPDSVNSRNIHKIQLFSTHFQKYIGILTLRTELHLCSLVVVDKTLPNK